MMVVPPVLREIIVLAVALAEAQLTTPIHWAREGDRLSHDHAGNLARLPRAWFCLLLAHLSVPLGSPVAWHTLAVPLVLGVVAWHAEVIPSKPGEDSRGLKVANRMSSSSVSSS